jgi:GGDEF domain-containing protein
MNRCPLRCGSESELRIVDAGGVTLFICPECLGIAFDAAILCDPRRPIDLTRLLRPVIEKIRTENSVDHLTQTKNRPFFFRRLMAEIQSARHRTFISIAAFRIDLVDLYARLDSRRADMALQAIAAKLLSSVRTGDDLARVEPDTFGLILRNADETAAKEIAYRIVKSIAIVTPGNGHPLPLRIGCAVVGADELDPEEAWASVLAKVRQVDAR